MEKFNLLFGGIWVFVSGLMMTIFYFADTVTVNGVPTSHDEFVQLLWPKLLLGGFFTIGLAFLIPGILSVIKNRNTKKYGEEVYGVITEIGPTNVTVNGRPVLRAKVSVYVPSRNIIEEYYDEIGVNGYTKYSEGSFVKLKIYKNDINIGEAVDASTLPTYIYDELKGIANTVTPIAGINGLGNLGDNVTTADEIMVNGVRYKRMD